MRKCLWYGDWFVHIARDHPCSREMEIIYLRWRFESSYGSFRLWQWSNENVVTKADGNVFKFSSAYRWILHNLPIANADGRKKSRHTLRKGAMNIKSEIRVRLITINIAERNQSNYSTKCVWMYARAVHIPGKLNIYTHKSYKYMNMIELQRWLNMFAFACACAIFKWLI